MSNQTQRNRFSLKLLFGATAFIAVVVAAFCRGNFLLGLGPGIGYAIVAFVLCLLTVGVLIQTPIPKFQLAIIVFLSIPVGCFLLNPQFFNTDVRFGIEVQAVDRNARSELRSVFATDIAFSELWISTTHLKRVNVKITGSVPTVQDLERLQSLVFKRCRFVKHCSVHWRITSRNDSKTYAAMNDEAFQLAQK